MPMRVFLPVLLALAAMAVVAGPASAQVDDRAWDECKRNPEPDWVIYNCTAVIEGAGDRSASRRARALVLRAGALVKKKEIDRARGDYNRAVKTASFNPEILVARGDFLLAQNEIEAAGADYEAAIEIEPRTPKAVFGLATIARQRGDLNGAVQLMDKVIAMDPRNARARVLRSEWHRAAKAAPASSGS